MREILFKAKRADNGKWVEGYYNYCNLGGECIIAVNNNYEEKRTYNNFEKESYFYKVIPETVCQYTGRQDTDETKAFEGDIFWDSDYEQEFVIEWDDEVLAWMANSDDGGQEFLSDIWNGNCRIVGNIHDEEERK